MRMPSLFLSHGAPTLARADSATARFLDGLGAQLPLPRAIVIASAHYETRQVRVSGAAQPATIHDFGGFPAPLYQIRYPAPGDAALAARVVERLGAAGIDAAVDAGRGLDHGMWVPLLRMYPHAQLPVVGLSVLAGADGASANHAVGRALEALRDEGVLVIGSGGLTHNLRELDWQAAADAAPVAYAAAFADWTHARLVAGDIDALLDWERTAPHARRNHPSPEHLMPLYTALGAGGARPRATRLHHAYEMGALCLDAWRFD